MVNNRGHNMRRHERKTRQFIPGEMPTGHKGRTVFERYGRWTLVERIGTKTGSPLWRCKCDCGTVRDVILRTLRRGASTSCGCRRIETTRQRAMTHGETDSVEYRTWSAMMNRCHYSTNAKEINNYQNRGIVVCDRWRDFENFLMDMGRRPSSKHSIDRIDNDGNYEPSNCRWATAKEQRRNQRRSVSLTTKLAAALLALGHIPYEEAKTLSAGQIISRYQFDHYPILKAFEGSDEPWNLRPMLVAPHREKSRRDTSIVAKVKRIRADLVLAGVPKKAKAPVPSRAKRRIAQRPDPWPARGTRKFQKKVPEPRVLR